MKTNKQKEFSLNGRTIQNANCAWNRGVILINLVVPSALVLAAEETRHNSIWTQLSTVCLWYIGSIPCNCQRGLGLQFKAQFCKWWCDWFHSFKCLMNVCHSAVLNVIPNKDIVEKSEAKPNLGQFGLWSYNCCSCSLAKTFLFKMHFVSFWQFITLLDVSAKKKQTPSDCERWHTWSKVQFEMVHYSRWLTI